jgi:O-methyltransferase involved in polyketide biosynthesis
VSSADYLTGHGWQVTAHPAPELYQRNGFTFPEDESMAMFRKMSYVGRHARIGQAMARTHEDSWDLASSVGATATMIAAGRAMATKDPRGPIDQRSVRRPLVRAVGLDFFVKMIDGSNSTSRHDRERHRRSGCRR